MFILGEPRLITISALPVGAEPADQLLPLSHKSSPPEPVQIYVEVIVISSDDVLHGLFDIVHLKTYVTPAVPLSVEVGLVGVVIVPPVPLTIVHNPVPTAGVFPARVADIVPPEDETFWSGPAFAVVGI